MSEFVQAPVQPVETMIYEADGLFIKQIVVEGAHVFLPQHAHSLSHITLLTKGRIRVRLGDGEWQTYEAPTAVMIEARIKHLFETLENETVLYCVHALNTPGALKVLAEHKIV